MAFDEYSQKDFLYYRLGPWPQPSPDHPQGKAPAVVHIPEEEQKAWNRRIGWGYLRTAATKWPKALAMSLKRTTYDALDDAAFEKLLVEGIYARFLCQTLDPIDQERFAPILTSDPNGIYWKMDFTPIQDVKPWEGMYVAPTVVLVKQVDGVFKVVAVHIHDNLLLQPGDGPAWELCKYFVMQGAAYGILFTVHPNLHFPFDSINAITKSAVPTSHPLFQILEPHLEYQLALNNAVLNSPETVISESRDKFYAPFTARGSDGLMAFFVAGYQGIEGNSAYPPFDYPEAPVRVPGTYGQFLDAYYPPFLTFARAILKDVPEDDAIVAGWLDYIRQWIPGFAGRRGEVVDGCEPKADPALLPDVVAAFLWDVTVAHSVDHAVFGRDIGVYRHCLRLRLPPPASKDMEPFDPQDLVTKGDLFRAHMAEMLFFVPRTHSTLMTCSYRFTRPEHVRAVNALRNDLREVEARLKAEGVPIYMALEEISASIQY